MDISIVGWLGLAWLALLPLVFAIRVLMLKPALRRLNHNMTMLSIIDEAGVFPPNAWHGCYKERYEFHKEKPWLKATLLQYMVGNRLVEVPLSSNVR